MNDVYAKFKAYVDAKPDSKRPFCCLFLYGVWFDTCFGKSIPVVWVFWPVT